DLLERQQRVVIEETLHIPIIDVDPELVKFIRRGQFRIEPDCPRGSFPHFLSARRGEEWEGHGERFTVYDATDKFYPGDHVTPLVVPPHLQYATITLEQHQKVVRLQQLVVEFKK